MKYNFLISWLSVGFLVVCLFSGIVVTFDYNPNDAFKSVELISYKLPYGLFFRKLHYFSGEAFIVFTLLHVAVEIFKHRAISKLSYLMGSLALVLGFALMFTGYVLKADLNAVSAGQIALEMIKQTPLLNLALPFFKDTDIFFWRFFLWHILIFPAILLYILKIHCNIFTKYFLLALAICFIMVYNFPLPKDINPDFTALNVSGPWFFHGAQNLLEFGLPAWFVVFILGLGFLFLVGIRYFENRRAIFIGLFFSWVIFYAVISFI